MPDLSIQLLQSIDKDLTQNLEETLENLTGYFTSIKKNFIKLDSFLDKDRQQYNAIKIIESVEDHKFDKAVLIADADIFIPIFTFVFGLAKLGGKTGIVSLHRLNNLYYGLPQDNEILKNRLLKEIVHELGHLQGLKHCDRYDCVMTASTVVEELDLKKEKYCDSCLNRIKYL